MSRVMLVIVLIMLVAGVAASAESNSTSSGGLYGNSTAGNSTIMECLENAGYDPDRVIYLYTNTCGADEKSSIRITGLRKGVRIWYLDAGILTEEEKNVLKCFYGPYSKTNKNYKICPRLLCPKTGGYMDVGGRGPVISQAGGFMLNCR
jgi:hypothetical protein